MSMLTPPGMGGKYRIKGDKYPRMRPPRRRVRLVFLTVACAAVIGVIGWGTVQLIDVFTGGGKTASASSSTADCTTRAGRSAAPSPGATAAALPNPAQITVNVFNATPRSGLAKQTADELKKRGFRIGEVGNATEEYDKKVPGTGILLGSPSSLNASLPVLATQLSTAERRTDAARTGTTIDLILGNGFTNLTARADADKALTALTAPQPAPTATNKSC